jgi:hypothetical protein
MAMTLRDGVSFCEINDHLVFLDVREDRYYGLAGSAASLVRSGTALAPLRQKGLIESDGAGSPFRPFQYIMATHELAPLPRPSLLAVATAIALHRKAIARLKSETFSTTISRLQDDRVCADRPDLGPTPMHFQCVSAFRACAPLFDQLQGCLTRSLALMSMLSRRSAPASLVIGVKLNPFAAHAWVQVGHTLLNETLDIVSVYKPIASF